MKWKEGFKCVKCGHFACQIRRDFSRTYNKCSHTESATANTLFHKVKFGVRKAFFICFEMAATPKSLSVGYRGVRFGVTEKTARRFVHKVREAMKSSGNHPIKGEKIYQKEINYLGASSRGIERKKSFLVFSSLIFMMMPW